MLGDDPFGDGTPFPGWDIYSGLGRPRAEVAIQMAASGWDCQANIVFPTANFIDYDTERHNPIDRGRSHHEGRVFPDWVTDIESYCSERYLGRLIKKAQQQGGKAK